MTRPFKLAILRAVHDGSSMRDTDFLDFVMTDQKSVLRYWEDITNGWFDFTDSAVFPWVTITVNPSATQRADTWASTVAAVRAANPGHDPLAGFDGAYVLLHPGLGDVTNPKAGQPGEPAVFHNSGFDGGSSPPDVPLRYSVIPTKPSTHTFACHELGHTLGADHTFGLVNSGIDYTHTGAVGPEYGDPYDIMSALTFAERVSTTPGQPSVYFGEPTFGGTVTTDFGETPWPGPAQMGPMLARANLHRWFPEAMTTSTLEVPFPAPGASGVHRITHAAAASGHTLLILHPVDEAASGVGRVYVEYRPAENWDRGLGEPGCGLSRPGVVVHTLEDVPTKTPRVWYRGSIADDDPDTDLRLATRPLVLTVTDRGQDGEQWVELTVTPSTRQAAMVTVEGQDTIEYGNITEERQTPCHDRVSIGTWFTKTKGICRVTTTGLEPDVTASQHLTVDWTVGGTAVEGVGAADMEVTSVDGARQKVTCSFDSGTGELDIFTEAGERYTLEVLASVAVIDPAVGTTARVEATATFTPSGSYTGLHPSSILALGKCLARKAHELYLEETIDVAALLDHHEVWQWQQDTEAIKALIATGSGPLVGEFQSSVGVGPIDVEVPPWQVPNLYKYHT